MQAVLQVEHTHCSTLKTAYTLECKQIIPHLDVHESMHRDTTMKETNQM
jgi:hypothetical protein